MIRSLAVAASAATVVGSVLMRRWDRAAGKRVAQLSAARTRDEWKTDERIAELETDLEETRLQRGRLEGKLRAKRAELARLRTEHADLLRRYATAETERASALEGRRLLEKGAPKDGGKGPGGGDKAPVPKALEAAGPASGPRSETSLDAAAYRKAAEALKGLERKAATRRAEDGAAAAPAAPVSPLPSDVPVARRPTVRTQGGFDFFGNSAQANGKKPVAALPAARPVEEQDLADVVGEEALAEAGADAGSAVEVEDESDGEVIDLTAHDETEQIDVVELRSAIS
ncbi:hypothetical protein [Streptomyces sp. DSM 41493]